MWKAELPSGARIAAIVAGILAVSLLHHATPPTLLHWHNAYQNLYYLPIVVAGLRFGWRGGLAAAILAGLSNTPYNLTIWPDWPNQAIDQMWDLPLFCAAGILSGVLAEQGRKQRADLERTTRRLTEVYQQLQDNFERMKRAERLFALGQLSAGLAHEVRNPLASIAGAVGILQRNQRLEDRDAECLGIISKECQRLNRLVTDFLAFARPRTPHYLSADIEALLDSVIGLASHATGGKPITLRREPLPPVGSIECDPELLKQVLLNLAINAIQAMHDGGEVRLSARRREGRVLIEVKDEGCGIGEADRDRIFDPFFTTKPNGTGLGLSVAHQVVEQFGGILSAESNPGGGMTFAVLLPVPQEKAS
jgi:two-component system, NtrC family, sensor histidine kinase HydH